MVVAKDIGDRIRVLRKQKRVSQEVMAADLGMYQADISNLERAMGGSGIGDLFKLDSIADYFSVSIVELLTGLSADAVETLKSKNARTMAAGMLPRSEPEDLFAVDFANLSEVYRYRTMIEAVIDNPSVYDTVDDIMQKEKDILNKLKVACLSEEAYKVWKKDYIDAKVKETSQNQHILACTYVFAGIGQYTEYLPEDKLEEFKAWIACSGSAFLGEIKEANKQQIRSYVKQHIADELFADGSKEL